MLYAARRKDPELGGLGPVHLEKMLGVPREHLHFPLWYLKKKGLIEILHTGQLGITIDGIDNLTDKDRPLPEDRLLTETHVDEEGQPSSNGGRPEPQSEQPEPRAQPESEPRPQPEPERATADRVGAERW